MRKIVYDAIALAMLLEDALGTQLVDGFHETDPRHARHGIEHLVRRARSDDRGYRGETFRIIGESIQPRYDRLANGSREIEVGDFPPVPLALTLIEATGADDRFQRLFD